MRNWLHPLVVKSVHNWHFSAKLPVAKVSARCYRDSYNAELVAALQVFIVLYLLFGGEIGP